MLLSSWDTPKSRRRGSYLLFRSPAKPISGACWDFSDTLSRQLVNRANEV
jgi:hypothetical protein